MKDFVKNIGLLVMLIVSVYAANALATDKNTLLIGSTSTEASNILRGVTYDVYGNADISFVTADHIQLYEIVALNGFNHNSNSSSKNNINVSAVEKTFDGSTRTVLTIKGRIPEGLDAVDDRGRATTEEVAELRFREAGNHSNTASIRLSMQRASHLEMKKITLMYGADEELKLTDGKKIDEMKSGETATIEYQIENTFSSSENLEMDDIMIFMRDAGNDLDIDEDQDMDSIDTDDDDKESLSFDLPDDLDEDDYTAYIYVTGNDMEYNARHGEFMEVTFQIEKENNEMTIKRLALEPNTIDLCTQTSTSLTLTIENTGSRNQKDAAMSVSAPSLQYSSSVADLELDEGDSKTKTFQLVVQKETPVGNYPIIVRSYFDGDEVSDERTIYLYVNNCKTPATPIEDDEEDENDDSADEGDNEIVEVVDLSGGKKPTTNEQNDDKSDSQFITPKSLVLAIIVIILFIVVIVMAVSTRRR